MVDLDEPRGCHFVLERWADGARRDQGALAVVAGPGLQEVYLWQFQRDRGRLDAGGKEW